MSSSSMNLDFKQVFTLEPSTYGDGNNSKLDTIIKKLNLWAIIGGPIAGLIKLVILVGNTCLYPTDRSIRGYVDGYVLTTLVGERKFSYLLTNAIRAIGDCFFLGVIFIVIDLAADKCC